MSLVPATVRPNIALQTYNEAQIKEHSSISYQTHDSALTSLIYKVCAVFTAALRSGVYWFLSGGREATGFGADGGAGGVPKKFSYIKGAAWIGLAILTLPLTILGIVGQIAFHPNKELHFLNAAKEDYVPPKVAIDQPLLLATYNTACLPNPIAGMMDVLPSTERMSEFVEWVKDQDDLPLVLGLQEVFCHDAAEVIADGIKELYPYAVTSAGWADPGVPLAGGNSGFQIYSRVPIKSAAFHAFEDLRGFGVKCSARGFLRVEVDLGDGRSARVYMTHTQAHAEKEDQEVRKQELELILAQMRSDEAQDMAEGIVRDGYYLMGDTNVGNVNDENGDQIDEYEALRQPGEVFSEENFMDPYLTEHDTRGNRTSGSPYFLERDVHNEQRVAAGKAAIAEPKGSFYYGVTLKDRGFADGYGTEGFESGPHEVVADCVYDRILRLRDEDESVVGLAEIRHVIPHTGSPITTSALSDHALVTAVFCRR